MPRIIFYTDAHASGVSPENRLDDYPAKIPEKIAEVYQIAARENCDFAVFGGDLFNTHKIYAYDVMGSIMDSIEQSGLKTYAVIGQHDLAAYNETTYRSSSAAFVESRSRGMFETLWNPLEVSPGIILHPCHVWNDPMMANLKAVDSGKINILVAHCLLTNNLKSNFSIINTADFAKGCPYDVVLSGDLHDGYETHSVGNTIFCNPGSLGRRTVADVERMPQVAIVDITMASKGRPMLTDVKLVRISCAKPGLEVFDMTSKERREESSEIERNITERAEKFSSLINNFESECEDAVDLVIKVAEETGILDDVLGYLRRKRDEIRSTAEKNT